MSDRAQQAYDAIQSLSGATPSEARRVLDEYSVKDIAAALAAGAASGGGAPVTTPLELAPTAGDENYNAELLFEAPADFESSAGKFFRAGYSSLQTAAVLQTAGDPVHNTFLQLNTSDSNSYANVDSLGIVNISGATAAVYVSDASGNPVVTASESTGLLIGVNSAPADGALNANEAALWFDATNGAAKLMIKAKQANGTVKTGSVNVQT